MLPIVKSQGIGSFKSDYNILECLWMIKLNNSFADGSFIRFEVENNLNISCQENAIYVYNSISEFTGQKKLLSIICKDENIDTYIIDSRLGEMSIFFRRSIQNQGFNGIISIFSCKIGTCSLPFICDRDENCVCPHGKRGLNCEIEICKTNCKNGVCDIQSGKCICNAGFGGEDCLQLIKPSSIIIQELFNTFMVSNNQNHLKKTLPRFGHSVNTDRRGFIWIFGGFSHTNGALNDIRQYDTKNLTWLQVTIDGSDIKMPSGRFFHAAEIFKQSIYIFGGISNDFKMLKDFWNFDTHEQKWSEVEVNGNTFPPNMAGHVMAIDGEKLLMIGGYKYSNEYSLIWEFDFNKHIWTNIQTTGYSPGIIYDHSISLHSQSQTYYVFGGYQLFNGTAKISNHLYNLKKTLNNTWSWNFLPTFDELNRPEENLPRGRFLHSTVAFKNYLLIYSGNKHLFSL